MTNAEADNHAIQKNGPQKGDILVLSHKDSEQVPIHALFCSGNEPLQYPVKGETVLHGVGASQQVAMHTLPFYISHAYDGSKLHIFRPKNPKLGETAFAILTHWYQMGVYFDDKIKKRQENPDKLSAQATFTPLRAIKQHFSGTYSNFYSETFSHESDKSKREVGVTCHSLLIDAFNLAALKLFFEAEGMPLAHEQLHFRISNYGKINKAMESEALIAIKRTESEQHKKKGEYYSPVNFMTVPQRGLLDNGRVLQAMPFKLNSKIAPIMDFFSCLKQSDNFQLIGRPLDKADFKEPLSKEEYVQKMNAWLPLFNANRSSLRKNKLLAVNDPAGLRQKNIEHRKSGIACFKNKEYRKSIEAFSREKFDYMLPLEQADYYYNIARCQEELGEKDSALENFMAAEKIYKIFLQERHPDLKKTVGKIQQLSPKDEALPQENIVNKM